MPIKAGVMLSICLIFNQKSGSVTYAYKKMYQIFY